MSSLPADQEVLAQFEAYARSGDRALRNELVVRHRWIAVHCATRFSRRTVPVDDLIQVAQIGVLKAVERFDPEYGVQFATFAIPTVMGELRRHFRDATWAVKVTRRHKDRAIDVGEATERLAQRLGRLPSVSDIARDLDVADGDVREAMRAGATYWTTSLDRPSDAGDGLSTLTEVRELTGEATTSPEHAMLARDALRQLPDRERHIVYLRYFQDLTQQEIADVMGISQVHVSRLLRSALARLRHDMEDDELEVVPDAARRD